MRNLSLYAYFFCCALMLLTAFGYYPKWKQPHTEATISWDVSGYYMYLPAALIYRDIKQVRFFADIEKKYAPGPGMGQAFLHPSGNYVMKYSMGQALQMLPWFTAAHVLAEPLGYPADGFSLPYQAAQSWGALLVAFLGLWFLRRVLLLYFTEGATAAALICIVWGTNYLEYTAISGAMTHNWLFTVYALLLFFTHRFYRDPSMGTALILGLLIGWAGLTRPTEVVIAAIPVLWGLGSWSALKERIAFFQQHWLKLLSAVVVAGAVLFLQAAYWKYATGEWLVYSYQDQGFSWKHPHLRDVLVSARAGWFVYSPMMLLTIPGFFLLKRYQKAVFPAILLLCLLCLYITAAWDIWWYGGSLGQRAMIQSYPLWAFALAAFWQWAGARNWSRVLFSLFAGLCIYLNLWWTHQAHRGGYFVPEQMNTPYLLKVLGRFDIDKEAALKLLDTREEFTGAERKNVLQIGANNFEQDSVGVTEVNPIEGKKSKLLDKDHEFATCYESDWNTATWGNAHWLRSSVWFNCNEKEWELWKMSQLIVRFMTADNKVVKERMIRLQRHVDGSELKSIYFDTQIPKLPFSKVLIFCWSGGSEKTVRLDKFTAELFE